MKHTNLIDNTNKNTGQHMTVRKRTYESKNSYQDVFTRVRIDVERVDPPTNPMVGNLTVDTHKPWVGKIDSGEGTFKIIQTNPSILPFRFFDGNFFDIFIHGKVSADEGKTMIDVKFRLGWFYSLIFFMTYSFPILLAARFISEGDWERLKDLTIFFLVITIIPTLLLLAQLNRVENVIADLLGAE